MNKHEVLLRLKQVKDLALSDQSPSLEDLMAVAEAPLAALIEAAHTVTVAEASSTFNFCAIQIFF